MNQRGIALGIAGFCAGLAFLIACEVPVAPGSDRDDLAIRLEAGSDASARHPAPSEPATCTHWELGTLIRIRMAITGELPIARNDCDPPGSCPMETYDVAEGWEPIGYDSGIGGYLVRRCVD